jgi:precorrin-2 dehydrogenase/sirohydrochlorin ferrochelatase
MKNNHRYPVFLDMRKVRCLVVGGGKVAARKVRALRRSGADVRLVSPQITPYLRGLAEKKAVEWIKNRYSSKHLKNMRLAVAATNNAEVNHRIYNDAEKLGISANVVDDLDYCRFVAPARYSAGSLEIAVTTGGAAPVIAKIVRDEIRDRIGKRFVPAVALLGRQRDRIKRLSPELRKAFWSQVIKIVREKGLGGTFALKKINAALSAAESVTR